MVLGVPSSSSAYPSANDQPQQEQNISGVEDGLNTVWFSPLERPDGTVVGVVVAVDREDGFIEGAVNLSAPG